MYCNFLSPINLHILADCVFTFMPIYSQVLLLSKKNKEKNINFDDMFLEDTVAY